MGYRGRALAAVLSTCLSLTSAWGQTKKTEAPTIVVAPPATPTEETDRERGGGVPMIGLDAYHEVLASGQYVVGPGDEFVVYSVGAPEPYPSKVMAEGGLLVPGVGSVRVAGLRLAEARRVVEEAFHRSFRQGQVTVELSRLRTFPVTVVGVVGQPGVVTANGVERISELVNRAGGLGSRASRRNIRVARRGEVSARAWEQLRAVGQTSDYSGLDSLTRRVDLELFGLTGDSAMNPYAADGDLVIVPPRLGELSVVGALERSGSFFEFVAGDRVSNLLTLAQGVTAAYEPGTAVLYRYEGGHRRRTVVPVELERILAGDATADLPLQPEDWLVVHQMPGYNARSTVRILGEVVYPGYYVVEKGRTTLREVVALAGGFSDDASLREAQVIRLREDTDGGARDPEFERIAAIPVADRTEDDNQYFIMKTREKAGHMVVDLWALFEQGDESQNIVLQPDDVIVVPATPRTVMVSGQAAHPGAVVYNSTYRVADYIRRAGGPGWRASKDIRVIKARTGEMRRAHRDEAVEPGDRIWIKEKPVRDYWSVFTQTMVVLGQVSTMALLYATLR